jgi:hypothetical protein
VELHTPRGRVTQPHPLRQARDYALELVDLMQHDPALVHADGPFAGRLLFPYGWGVVLSRPEARRRGPRRGLRQIFPRSARCCATTWTTASTGGRFQHRLWGMFTVSYPHTLTLPQRDRIRWHLFPELRLQRRAR